MIIYSTFNFPFSSVVATFLNFEVCKIRNEAHFLSYVNSVFIFLDCPLLELINFIKFPVVCVCFLLLWVFILIFTIYSFYFSWLCTVVLYHEFLCWNKYLNIILSKDIHMRLEISCIFCFYNIRQIFIDILLI
jgi:hypothetical protein